MNPVPPPATAFLGLLLLGCPPGSQGPQTQPGDPDAQDTALPPALAPSAVETELSPHVGTVVRVRWQTDAPTRGRALFASGGTQHQTSWTPSDTEHEVLLLGLHPDSSIDFSIELEDDGVFGGYTAQTDPLPSGFPELSTTGARQGGGFQVVPITGAVSWVVVLDDQDMPVWYHHMPDLEESVVVAERLPDASGLLIGATGPRWDLDQGQIHWMDWWGTAVATVGVPHFDHDLTVRPDGSVALLQTIEGPQNALADSILEVSADGSTRQVWNAWDALYEDGEPLGSYYNWTHANALVHLPEEDAYLIHLREPGSTLKIDAQSGTQIWALNGRFNDFEPVGAYRPPGMQHGVAPTATGFLVFDNNPLDQDSQVRALAVDEQAMTVQDEWSAQHEPAVYIYALGDVADQGEGRTMVSWSTGGELQQLDAAHQEVWRLNTEISFITGYLSHFDGFYPEG